MALKNTHKYDDIIDLPRPTSQRRSRMTNYDRAAQFSPFAALTGFDAAIEETGRLTDRKIELDEAEKVRLDLVLQQIRGELFREPRIQVTYFVYDEFKSGGAYLTRQGCVRKIDSSYGALVLTDGALVPLREIIKLELLN